MQMIRQEGNCNNFEGVSASDFMEGSAKTLSGQIGCQKLLAFFRDDRKEECTAGFEVSIVASHKHEYTLNCRLCRGPVVWADDAPL